MREMKLNKSLITAALLITSGCGSNPIQPSKPVKPIQLHEGMNTIHVNDVITYNPGNGFTYEINPNVFITVGNYMWEPIRASEYEELVISSHGIGDTQLVIKIEMRVIK